MFEELLTTTSKALAKPGAVVQMQWEACRSVLKHVHPARQAINDQNPHSSAKISHILSILYFWKIIIRSYSNGIK